MKDGNQNSIQIVLEPWDWRFDSFLETPLVCNATNTKLQATVTLPPGLGLKNMGTLRSVLNVISIINFLKAQHVQTMDIAILSTRAGESFSGRRRQNKDRKTCGSKSIRVTIRSKNRLKNSYSCRNSN